MTGFFYACPKCLLSEWMDYVPTYFNVFTILESNGFYVQGPAIAPISCSLELVIGEGSTKIIGSEPGQGFS